MAEASQRQNGRELHADDSTANGWLLGAESDTQPTISVVMPTLNEEDGVRECIDRVRTALDRIGTYGEVIISDSSTDRTPEIAREMGAIVVEPDGKGYGYAYRYAFERVRGDFVVMGDADTTYDFEKIPELLEPVRDGDADICMGSRLEGEIRDGSMPTLHQYVGNPLLTAFLNAFYDAGVSDAHSGFRVFSREALEELDLKTDGMEFASEMIMDAGARDLDIEEKPIVYHEREGEETLDSFQDGWRHVRFMLVNAPGYLFSAPGLVLGLLGIAIMGTAVSGVSFGAVTLGPHSMIAGSLLTLVGFQVLNMGVFATVTSDPIQQPSDRLTSWLSRGLRLDRGATVGLALFGAGTVYAAVLVSQWVTSGFAQLPLVMADILAFTAIVLGLQTVFNSFLMSAVNANS
ncbi:glycosyltransferase family 2 protein [Haloarcula sp. S1CR25-12]|uniref:Glycosyltransferase family 2 protein n=1 Tax=Haloarcula saliterrae TaxID=2950534 RepID=A0ABU2FGT1_9EURY|nr:glycosyltransferase family 2 protein [Haloarcula sp. S1CR25-12]